MMKRDACFRILARHVTDEIVVASYSSAAEWSEINPRVRNYFSVGAMGLASSHGLGLALGRPRQRVLVLDGDGSLLMNLGSLVTIGPTVLAEQTLSPPSSVGTLGSPFGHTAGLVDINWFDAQLQSIISRFSQIQPNTLPVFLTYDVYLTQGGCCIGGYHSSEGSISSPQAYAHFTYIDHPGDFAQDVSALSHEVGEWADDPLVVNTNGNNTPCGILEVGDPEEGDANYGGFPYTLNGFTYNLQDLVTLPYFGAPTSTSVNGWLSFQGNSSLFVCSNGS
jgi:hypothetical protein